MANARTEMRIKTATWRGLPLTASVVVLAVGLALLLSCGPRAAKDTTPEKKHALKIEFFNSETESAVMRAWADYEPSLRRGDFLAAQHVLRKIAKELGGQAQLGEFVNEHLSLQSRRTLVLGFLCKACTDGKCSTCKGTGRCEICHGNGICTACVGKGALTVRCQRGGPCPVCNGTGKCSVCQGTQKQTCPVCHGTGRGSIERETCTMCGGSGMVAGLNGHTYPCNLCGGKGSWSRQRPCGNCGGTGLEKCAACGGSGICAACRGTRHDPKCPFCGGAGFLQQMCEMCKGSGECSQCNGSGKCRDCAGKGVCGKCQGSNVVVDMKLPVDVKWLKQDHGFAVEPTASVSIPKQQQGEKLDARLVHRGRIDLLCNQRKVALDVGDGEVVCFSASSSFGWVPNYLFQ